MKTQVNVGPMGQPRLISLLSVSHCFIIKRETIDFTLLHYPEKKMRNNLTNNSEWWRNVIALHIHFAFHSEDLIFTAVWYKMWTMLNSRTTSSLQLNNPQMIIRSLFQQQSSDIFLFNFILKCQLKGWRHHLCCWNIRCVAGCRNSPAVQSPKRKSRCSCMCGWITIFSAFPLCMSSVSR